MNFNQQRKGERKEKIIWKMEKKKISTTDKQGTNKDYRQVLVQALISLKLKYIKPEKIGKVNV